MSGQRDRFLDLLRGGSIVGVVVGHWLVADVRWDGTEVVETSALAEEPSLWPLSWLVLVIPLFFFVGGFANAHTWDSTRARGEGYAAFVDRRAHRLLAPLLVYLAVATVAGALVAWAGGLGVQQASIVLLQPLWFLGIYVLAIGLTPLTLSWHRRWGWGVPVALLTLAVLADLAVFGLGATGVGYLNAIIVWVLVHQLGYFYAEGRLTRVPSALMCLLGWTTVVLLTQHDALPYSSFMVGVPGVDTGNMHPPTMAVVSLAVAAIGTVVLARPALNRWVRRPRVWRAVVTVNLSVMTLYLWHEAALVIAARLALPLGYPVPDPGSAAWWVSRLTWLLIPGLVLAGLVMVFGRFERVSAPSPAPDTAMTRRAAAVSIVLLSAGTLALTGSSVAFPLTPEPRLGPIMVSALLGIVLTGTATWVLVSLRQGDGHARRALVGAAAALAVGAVGYGAGVGPLPQEPIVGWTLATSALLPAVTALTGARVAREGRLRSAGRPLTSGSTRR